MDEYNAKKRTAEEAVQVVRSGDWVEFTFGPVSYTHLTLPTIYSV